MSRYYTAYQRDNNQHMHKRKGGHYMWLWVLLWFVLIMLLA